MDITLPGARPTLGHQHLINQIIDEIKDVFCGIGYTVEKGPQVETSYYNFTALNAPMDHPSRSARDTFYVADNAPGTASPVSKANAAALMERACTSRPMPAECSMVGTSREYGKPDSFRTEPSPCCRTMATALQSEVPITLHIV